MDWKNNSLESGQETKIEETDGAEISVKPWDRLKGKFRLGKKAKQRLTVACSLVLIGGAIVLNWIFFAGGRDASDPVGTLPEQSAGTAGDPASDGIGEASYVNASDGYFSTVQVSRQRARDEAMETLMLVVDSDVALQDAKDEAYDKISRIAANVENEANVEALIRAKGFEDCVAVIGDNSASVVVRSDGLLPAEVAQIQEIVCEQSGLAARDVTIIETAN